MSTVPAAAAASASIVSAATVVAMALAALSFSPAALAWGPAGHRTVGAIADRLLTEPARRQVQALLAGDLDRSGNPSGRDTLAAVSVWADEIRRTDADRPAWHYDDLPVCGALPAVWRCPDEGCATQAAADAAAVLADAGQPVRARNEALKWLVHLAGDLHQPLHAASNDDRGGNTVQVAIEGVRTRGRTSLHGAWDGALVDAAFGLQGERWPSDALVGRLAAQAAALAPERLSTDPLDWARESNALARSVAHAHGAFACGASPAGITVLDREYVRRATEVVRERIVLAGARLAALLNGVLGR